MPTNKQILENALISLDNAIFNTPKTGMYGESGVILADDFNILVHEFKTSFEEYLEINRKEEK